MYNALGRLENLLQHGPGLGIQKFYDNVYAKAVLEIGFGKGELLQKLFKQANKCTGIDASKLAILTLLEKNDQIPTLLMDVSLKPLPFQDGHFDNVYIYNTLEYLLNPLGCLLETKRVLKNDGILTICYYADDKIQSHPGLFSYKNMRTFLNNLYFKVVDEEVDGNYIYQKCENKKVDRMELLDIVNNNIKDIDEVYDDIISPMIEIKEGD